MTDHANELRRHARKIPHPQGETPGVMLRAAVEIMRLRAKVAEMEQQEPVMWQTRTRPAWNDGTWGPWRKCSEEYAEDIKKTPLLHDWLYEARTLYTLPGAKTQGEEK